MILDEYIEIIGNSKNLKYYKDKGYSIEVNKKILIKVEDLSNGSTFKVNIKCDICKKQNKIAWSSYYKYRENDKDKNYHCKKCCSNKRILTNQERYGGNSPTKSKKVVNKIKNTNQKKYGNNSSLHGNRQEKIEEIFIERYGSKTPLKNKEIIDKIKGTLLKKYGVDHPLKSKEILEKLKETNLNKLGVDNPSKSETILNKIKENNLNKWGVDWYFKSTDFKEKRGKKILDKYGVDNYFNSKHRLNFVINKKIENYPNLIFLDYQNGIFDIECNNCNKIFKIRTDLLYKRNKEGHIICTNCNKINNKFRSNAEIEISNFLKNNRISVETSRRDIIKGEIDIYLPEYKIAIEYNGLFWHSEIFKDSNYHLSKYNNCKNLGIKLIQIWEDQWNEYKDKVKSFILSKLKIYKSKIWARNCKIQYVNSNEKDMFLDNNHLQKSCKSSINIGLYYNNELVSIMTFGKRRLNSKENFELIRYCCKTDLLIVGGASKLFNYFIKNYNFKSIISYSDNAFSDGDIYKILNFKNINENINYYWTNNKERYHRFTFNKKRLVKMGYDINKTELEIMKDNGFNRIYGAGIKTWVYQKN
jgi:hypothetical protein